MANPQKEHGHIEIANAILEAFMRTQFSDSEHRVLLAILRKTWGWGKKEDWIAVSQFVEMTGLHERRVREALASMKVRQIIRRDSVGVTAFLKDFDNWLPPAEIRTPPAEKRRVRKSAVPPAEIRRYPLRKSAATKDTITKDTTTKDSMQKMLSIVPVISPTPAEEAARFFETPEARDPIISWMETKGITREAGMHEIEKFVLYWTEPTPNGKRQRWQTEKTFEVKRRLVTWLTNASKRGRYNSQQAEPKGIRL